MDCHANLQTTLESFMLNPPTQPNSAWSKWKTLFNNISNIHAPIRSNRVKSQNKPWITYEAIQLMYERNHTHNKWTKTKEQVWLDKKYKILRNLVSSKIRYDKSEYFRNGIDKANGKPRRYGI